MSLDASAIAAVWLTSFEDACRTTLHHPALAPSLFVSHGWWRDLLCLSWDLRTLEGVENISRFIASTSHELATFHGCTLETSPDSPVVQKEPSDMVQFTFRFKFKGKDREAGRAVAKLVQDDGKWKAFVLLTILESLKGYAEDTARPRGHYEGHTRPWDYVHHMETLKIESDPTVVVIGAGHAGLMSAVRIRRLGINVLVIEKNQRVGDRWRNRYDLMTLHTTLQLNEFPFQQWPDNTPTFIGRSKLADFMEYYAQSQELTIWANSSLVPKSATYDRVHGVWTVTILRQGKEVILRPRHLVMATGIIDKPNVPQLEGRDLFAGEIIHSNDHKNANPWRRKNVTVIGAGVSGSDIALEAHAAGAAQVLLVQRSPSVLVRVETSKTVLQDVGYPPDRPVEESDLLAASTPINLLFRLSAEKITPAIAALDKDVHDGLRKQGFLIGWGEEIGKGPIGYIGVAYTKVSGYCLDVGCAQLIIDGKVKVKSGVTAKGFDKSGVLFSDGTRADSDVVVLATGHQGMYSTIVELLGAQIAEAGGKIWDMDKEGELNGVFRPIGQPGLWYAAGGFADCRWMSKLLALQIAKCEMHRLSSST